jgi:two-component system, cell cycle response regulator DivK
MKQRNVLIVDDNPMNMKLVRVLLTAEGYQVRTAADALEALDILKEWRPLLILMDIQLPGIDGLELTRRLKADPGTEEIIIIGLTAYAMKGDEGRILAAGCDAYIAKPIDTRTLPDVIATLIEKNRPIVNTPRAGELKP